MLLLANDGKTLTEIGEKLDFHFSTVKCWNCEKPVFCKAKMRPENKKSPGKNPGALL